MEQVESEFVQHVPCEKCGSSDANALYDDGHTYCFSCGKPSGATRVTNIREPKVKGNMIDGEHVALKARGITTESCKKFNYKVGQFKGRTVQIANYYKNGAIVGQKIRDSDKRFTSLGNMKDVELFGQHLWRDGGKKVVVTEGEIDCMTVSQLQLHKWAVVSINGGAQGAKKALKNNLEWLERFDLVVLLFDMDEVGQQFAIECAPLFSPHKCAIASLPLKDANEMLAVGRGAEVIPAIWDAKVYRPDGIVGIADLMDRLTVPLEHGLSFPWQGLTDATYGIRSGEMYTLGAGTGMGKSEFWKEVMVHLAETHNTPVGGIFLEETPEHTVRCLAGKIRDKLFHIPDEEWTDEQLIETVTKMQESNNYHLYDHFGHTDYEVIKARIRYMVVSLGCKHIFLDHITALVTGDRDNDERRQLDYIMTDIASLARELKFSLFMISHLATPEGKSHEEGGRVMLKHFRGSRAIGQWSNFVFGIERNQQDSDDNKKHVSTLRILKDRYTGRATGKCVYLGYKSETGRLFEIEDNPFAEETNNSGEF